MQRILLAIGGAAAFCAAVTFLLQIAISQGIPATEIVLVTSVATLLLSIGATVLAYRAFTRSNLVTAELDRLTRSMDQAVKDLSLRSDRESSKLRELAETVSSRPGKAGRSKAHDDAQTRQSEPAAPALSEDPETSAIDTALRRMVAGASADLSVQPIIAAGRGEAGGFEAHVHVQPEEGRQTDIRRLDRPVVDVDPAVYERMVVVTACEAIRRRMGEIGEKKPLHVAISSALLEDGFEFSAVLDIFKLHPATARSIVLSVPASLLASGQNTSALELLERLDIRLAAEDWNGTQDELERIRKAGIGILKVAADRLLDRGKKGKGSPDGATLVEMARTAGLEIIAMQVQTEEDAVSLIDMGVDLMSGERLAAPRLLKG